MPQPLANSPWQGLGLKPLPACLDPFWSAVRDFGLTERVREIPVTDTELLQVSHHLPIVIRLRAGPPLVTAIVDPTFHRARKVGRGGRWLPPYVPLALRCLPFWAEPADQSAEPAVATELGLTGAERGSPLRLPNGDFSAETKIALRTLKGLEQGMERLSQAALTLIVSDLLAPLERKGEGGERSPLGALFTVDEGQFMARSGRSLRAAMWEGFVALNLVGACLFSRRNFTSEIEWTSRHQGPHQGSNPEGIEAVLRARQPLPVGLDTSQTIDISKLL